MRLLHLWINLHSHVTKDICNPLTAFTWANDDPSPTLEKKTPVMHNEGKNPEVVLPSVGLHGGLWNGC